MRVVSAGFGQVHSVRRYRMTRRISPSATDLLFVPRDGRALHSTPPAYDDRPPERKTRRAGWFTALRQRSPLS
jgi:hypothetical protein